MRALLVINAALDSAREREIAAGAYPRKDYYELRDALGAAILDLAALDERRWTRLARRVVGPALAQALLAWSLSRDYDAVFADQESTGFALAALYKLPFFRGRRLFGHGDAPDGRVARMRRDAGKMPAVPGGSLETVKSCPLASPAPVGEPSLAPPAPSGGAWGDASPQTPANHGVWGSRGRVNPNNAQSLGSSPSPAHRERESGGEGHPRLTMIGHLLSPRGKQALLRGLRLRATIDAVVVHSSLQARLAARTLGLRPDQVELVPYQTDERFWAPREAPVEQQICSAGLEYRDYGTMIQAVADLPVAVVIAAASPWSTFTFEGDERALPAHVRVDSFDYAGLRDLYASSLFVVAPLHDVDNQAGITTILEAMAMGKAVVVSHTRGQTDVIRDRRSQSRAFPERSSQPDWAQRLGATDDTARGHTGIYVRPGDPDELRRAIVYLLEHPDEARAMGANGRRVIEETMGLDLFTRRMAAVIAGEQPVAVAVEQNL